VACQSFNQHYIGTMDYWEPAVTDGLARAVPVPELFEKPLFLGA
jgi:hypothetical protein